MCGRDHGTVGQNHTPNATAEDDGKPHRSETCQIVDCGKPCCGHAPINFFGVMFDTDLCAEHLDVATIGPRADTAPKDGADNP